MKTSESIKNIAPRLFSAKKKMTAIEKGGFNKHDGYAYAKLEDYMRVVRPCLEEEGLLLITSSPVVTPIAGRKTAGDKDQYACFVDLTLTVIDSESGEWIQVEARGEGQDRADKGVYKATTGGRKYGVAMLFDLVTTDDPENDSGDKSGGKPRKPANPADDLDL